MSEDMRSLLSAYKAEVEHSVPDRERDWGRLVQRIDAGTEPLPIDLRRPIRRRWLPWALGATAAIMLAMWGLTRVGWGSNTEDTSDAHMAADEVDSRSSVHMVEANSRAGAGPLLRVHPPEPEPAPEPEPESAPKPKPKPESKPKPKRRARAPKSAPRESPIIAEARSIRRIRAALRDGRGRVALERVAAHERAFPKGALTDELRVLEADALCELGRADEARKVAAAFIGRRPASPLAARARRICAKP